eukprot:15290857-Alexandrium_andersonii.AAC.1
MAGLRTMVLHGLHGTDIARLNDSLLLRGDGKATWGKPDTAVPCSTTCTQSLLQLPEPVGRGAIRVDDQASED